MQHNYLVLAGHLMGVTGRPLVRGSLGKYSTDHPKLDHLRRYGTLSKALDSGYLSMYLLFKKCLLMIYSDRFRVTVRAVLDPIRRAYALRNQQNESFR